MTRFSLLALLALIPCLAGGRELEAKPADPFFARYEGWKAPKVSGLLLQKGDRLAICGDSITEQKKYSVLLESVLTAGMPELEITCRQYGWSGEKAGGFLARMKNDVLRFKPTIATTCYGMNDHRYVPYSDEIGLEYRANQTAVVTLFKEAGVRVLLGSPGTISSVPSWVKTASGTWEDLNSSLCRLRNLDIEIAGEQGVGFADVYWPMLLAMHAAEVKYGPEFDVSGDDGVHPGWAGQVMMAAAFLQAMGVDGQIGELSVDLAAGRADAGAGHSVRGFAGGKLDLTSSRWPFCAAPGPLDHDDSIHAGMALCDFDQRFNRLTLKVTGLKTERARIGWGGAEKSFSRDQLAAGINLATEFPANPFSGPYEALTKAVEAKQAFETKQIKQIFHGDEGRKDMEAAVAATEKEREPLAAAVKAAVHPVDHSVIITPEP